MQIIQQKTSISAQEEAHGVNIIYSYEFEKDQKPYFVTFSASRKDKEGNYIVPIQGTVTEHNFDVQNNNFQVSDIELYKHIHEACSALIKGESAEKPKANDTKK
jgi:hypothetical protein|nr:MAG TPA: hypothetical protein [Caudoviricetes sp.]DAR57121.1 MAG TPA: hypothetical protein [Caudoviricetes sp.]